MINIVELKNKNYDYIKKEMESIVGDTVKVKASGGIKDCETCKVMIDTGAERIGTSSSIKILQEFEEGKK